MYLILSSPSIEYAEDLSRELWMLARPRGISDNETSQFFCGWYTHPTSGKVALGPVDDLLNIHELADVDSFSGLIYAEVNSSDNSRINQDIYSGRGGSVNVYELLGATGSFADNTRTREQLETQGWFPTEELI